MTSKQKNLGQLTFGLDIGIASVGWAVLGEDRIVDMGVRAFDAAEDKDGKPNNQTRRGARVSRNRYDMRTWRLKKLVRLFRDVGMLSKLEIKHLFSAQHDKNVLHVSPWQLRDEGLSRPLTNQEWAQVIFHLVKHRGFKFFSKSEDPLQSVAEDGNTEDTAAKAERDGLKDGLSYTAKLLKKYRQFQTLGQAAYQLANAQKDRLNTYRDSFGNALDTEDCEGQKEKFDGFQNAYRNKGKSYRHAFQRDDLQAELNALFDAQHKHGNPYSELTLPDSVSHLTEIAVSSENRQVAPTFRAQVFALLELQHPPIGIEQMNAMIGDCELENEARNGKAEKRAAKHTFSNERATWLQTLNNLRIKRDGKETPLTEQERSILLNLPYTQGKLTFKQARELLREQTGFPAHWREAGFTKVSYRNKRKNNGDWLNVVSADGTKTTLNKYIKNEKTRKEINKNLKARLEVGTMTFAELRQLYQLVESEAFEYQSKSDEIIPVALEDQYLIAFDKLDSKKIFIELMPAKGKSTKKFSPKAMNALESLRTHLNPTFADLRIAIEQAEQQESGWQFKTRQKDTRLILLEGEASENVPIEYEDAQEVEDTTLIELKGWHALRRALEDNHPAWWASLQVAWLEPQSEAGMAAARQMDEIAEVLTKAQTDADVRKGFEPLQLDDNQRAALEGIRFKQYRNLSLKALRNILPFLEQGKSYKESCDLAGYQPVTPPARTRHLPPLETYLYERVRHDRATGFKKTGYTEQRYKDLNNPVVARAFNQARLVLNALIDRYDQSPAYVHIELARDIAKPLKGKWSNGKYIEGRQDISKKQEENSKKRQSARNNFVTTYNISDPNSQQILKERLYQEQQCHCVYCLKELFIGDVVRDRDYAQVDHVFPRSLTFDNSMENLVLVHTGCNQNKGNRIPYDYIRSDAMFGGTDAQRAEHWRRVAFYVMSCKGMSDNKQKRLLATELDADEFRARNLVDTRYATRLFARMVRDRLLFDGQTADQTDDIDPDESGKIRLEKFQKTRVRTPQGGVVSFLRGKWLGNIKDREAGDTHHAMDACIIAACTSTMILRVNNWFSNQEKVPNRFKKLDDGKYADKGTGEIISKDEARERGLYLPPPWEGFRNEFLEKYPSVFVSRAIRKKRNVELHSANPMALRYYPVNLCDLTLEMLDEKQLPPNLPVSRLSLIEAVRRHLSVCEGDAVEAFKDGFTMDNKDIIHTVQIPLVSLPQDYLKQVGKQLGKSNNTATRKLPLNQLTLKQLSVEALGETFYHRNSRMIDALVGQLKKFDDKADEAFATSFYPFGKDKSPMKSVRLPADKPHKENFEDTAQKNVSLTQLTLKKLTIAELGATFYHRNSRMIEAIKAQLTKFNDKADAAFAETFYPFGKDKPSIKSIRLPAPCGSGIHVRGGVAGLGDALYTEMYKLEGAFWFRARYKVPSGQAFGLPEVPEGAEHTCNLSKNDYVRIKHPNFTYCYRELSRHKSVSGETLISVEAIFENGIFEGYWNYFEPSNDRPVVQLHDGSPFFLLADGKMLSKKSLVLIERAKAKKKDNAPDEMEYVEFCEAPQKSPLKFSLVTDIKRKVNDAVFIEKVKIDILGSIQLENRKHDLA